MYAILGEMTRVQFDNPDMRMVARKMNAPGFTPQALADYIPKVCCHMPLGEGWQQWVLEVPQWVVGHVHFS